MGQQIALQCAAHGFEVVVLDADPEALARAKERLAGLATALAEEPVFAGVDLVQVVSAVRYRPTRPRRPSRWIWSRSPYRRIPLSRPRCSPS